MKKKLVIQQLRKCWSVRSSSGCGGEFFKNFHPSGLANRVISWRVAAATTPSAVILVKI